VRAWGYVFNYLLTVLALFFDDVGLNECQRRLLGVNGGLNQLQVRTELCLQILSASLYDLDCISMILS
jgi:hypothetical protein